MPLKIVSLNKQTKKKSPLNGPNPDWHHYNQTTWKLGHCGGVCHKNTQEKQNLPDQQIRENNKVSRKQILQETSKRKESKD